MAIIHEEKKMISLPDSIVFFLSVENLLYVLRKYIAMQIFVAKTRSRRNSARARIYYRICNCFSQCIMFEIKAFLCRNSIEGEMGLKTESR